MDNPVAEAIGKAIAQTKKKTTNTRSFESAEFRDVFQESLSSLQTWALLDCKTQLQYSSILKSFIYYLKKWEAAKITPTARFSVLQVHRYALFLVYQGHSQPLSYFSILCATLNSLRTPDDQRRLLHDTQTAFDIQCIKESLARTIPKFAPSRANLIFPDDVAFQNATPRTQALIMLWVFTGLRVSSFASIYRMQTLEVPQLGPAILITYSSHKRQLQTTFDLYVACACPNLESCLIHGPLAEHLPHLQLPTTPTHLHQLAHKLGYQTHSPRRTLCAILVTLGILPDTLRRIFNWSVKSAPKLIKTYTAPFQLSQCLSKHLFNPTPLLKLIPHLKRIPHLIESLFLEEKESEEADLQLLLYPRNVRTSTCLNDSSLVQASSSGDSPSSSSALAITALFGKNKVTYSQSNLL